MAGDTNADAWDTLLDLTCAGRLFAMFASLTPGSLQSDRDILMMKGSMSDVLKSSTHFGGIWGTVQDIALRFVNALVLCIRTASKGTERSTYGLAFLAAEE
jgi:hypothetical protein